MSCLLTLCTHIIQSSNHTDVVFVTKTDFGNIIAILFRGRLKYGLRHSSDKSVSDQCIEHAWSADHDNLSTYDFGRGAVSTSVRLNIFTA